jgi:hypothetical protein
VFSPLSPGTYGGNVYAADTGTLLGSASLDREPGGLAIAPASQITSGLSAGDGLLVVPAGNSIAAYVLSTTP